MAEQGNLAAANPQLIAEPAATVIDEPVSIRVIGLPAGSQVKIAATMPDHFDRQWRSHATFVADAHGLVDVSTQPPTSGSYTEADPMGLFWSMVPEPAGGTREPFRTLEPLIVALQAVVDDRVIATARVEWRSVAPAVAWHPVRDKGLAATLFLPPGSGPRPGVLCLSGSGGGLAGAEAMAALLAGHGYAALALAYFGFEQLPQSLRNIPLEYFETAIRWLRAQPQVRAERLAVIGVSRGGELALLLGATFPDLSAVVGYVPSGVIHAATSPLGAPSWTLRGAPLPYLFPSDARERREEADRTEPIALTPWFLGNLEDREGVERAMIPVERINGPVLLLSGEDDQMWPSPRLADLAVERLAAHRHPHPVLHHRYPGAGHFFTRPNLPATVLTARHPILGKAVAFGGTASANARAATDAWRRVLAFLDAWHRDA